MSEQGIGNSQSGTQHMPEPLTVAIATGTQALAVAQTTSAAMPNLNAHARIA